MDPEVDASYVDFLQDQGNFSFAYILHIVICFLAVCILMILKSSIMQERAECKLFTMKT